MTTTRHQIDFGESLRWEPPDADCRILRMGEEDR